MKAKTRKLLSLLLTLCMVIGLLPGMAVTAAAASDLYVTVNNNVFLTAAKPYYVNGKAQAEDPGEGNYTAKVKFEDTTATLTLKNYNGGRISYRYGDLTVMVNDSNVIDSPNSEGLGANGKLTVKGTPSGDTKDKDDSLTITSAYGCIRADGDLTIQDLKELNCSSTAVYNNCVKSSGALTLQNIGTARISLPNVGGGYAALLGRTSLTVTGVDDLEVSCGGDCVSSSSSAFGPISITAAKAALYSKGGNAICNYGGNVAVKVGTLIAVTDGGIAIRAANYSSNSGDVSASVTASTGLYIKGAVVQKAEGDPVVTCNGVSVEKSGSNVYYDTKVEVSDTKTVEITVTTEKEYTGQPVDVSPTAKDGDTVVNGLNFICTWYDSDSKLLGGTAPVDAGTYKLRVRAYGTVDNVAYTGDTGATLIDVTISRVAAPAEYKRVDSANITNGNNLITLPEIPSGMSFGAPVRCEADGSALSAAGGVILTPTLSGNLLSVKAENLPSSGSDKYYVKVPVTGTNCNYKDYNIILTLTNLTGKAIFDRCDGSEPSIVTIGTDSLPDTTLYNATTNDDGAWQAAIGNAEMYGYEFAGWYTAPNGWGQQVSDKNGYAVNDDGTTKKDENNNPIAATFTAGTTYYAKWVWTIGYVGGEPIDGDYYNVYLVYGVLNEPRTVYTTCLDFTNANMVNDSIVGDGYTFDGRENTNTLTLDGVHIQALDSVCGIILPAGSTIEVVSMPKNSYSEFWKFQEGNEEATIQKADNYTASGYSKASNIISCGSLDATADVFCLGSLTIHSDASNLKEEGVGLGNWLDAKQGGIKTAGGGTLTIQNANVDTTRLHADGDITVYDSLIFATAYSSTFTGDRYVRSYNGSVTIDQGWVFTEWLQAGTNLSISGRESRIRANFGASAGETISISGSGYKDERTNGTYNFALDFGNEENALWGLYAKNIEISNSLLNSSCIMTGEKLTISGGSEVNAHGSQTLLPICIYKGGSISNSTVNVTEVDSGSVGIYSTGPLTIRSSTVTVTKADGATPTATILAIVPENETGLALGSSAITVPSGGTVEKMVPPENNDDKTALWYIVKSNGALADEVTISPVVTPRTYPVTAPKETEGGSVAVSAKYAAKGRTVTLTVTANEGYELDSITVTDKNGKELTLTDKGDGKFTFTMPAGKVEISVAFKAVEPEPVGPAYEDFSDLEEDGWYHDGIAYVLDKGLMVGVDEGKFDPDGQTGRAMVATMLWQLADRPEAGAESVFTDVPAGEWYTDAVYWASANGITAGYGKEFGPDDPVTREQVVQFLYNFARFKGYDLTARADLSVFVDGGSTSGWAMTAMEWAVGVGILGGKGNGVLDPTATATRAEAATMLLRFSESMK